MHLLGVILVLTLTAPSNREDVQSPPGTWRIDAHVSQQTTAADLAVDFEGRMVEFVSYLRDVHQVAVSFVAAREHGQFRLRLSGPLRNVMEEAVRQDRTYAFRTIGRHLVVYPRVSPYETVLSERRILEASRIEAAQAYVAILNERVHALKDLAAPPLLGDPRNDIYSERVTLSVEGSILENLVSLLGERGDLFFSVTEAKSGVPMLTFDRLSRRGRNERRMGEYR